MRNKQMKEIVQGPQRSEKEPLNSIDPDSFYVTWEENSSWSLNFTARDDGSVAYKMLISEGSIFFDGQEYVIKQAEPDYVAGEEVKEVVAPHAYTEVNRVRIYKDYIDENDPSKNNQTDVKVAPDYSGPDNKSTSTSTKNGDTTTTVTKTDESDSGENQVYYSIQDVLSKYLTNNSVGITWEVDGNFEKARIAEITEGSGADMLSTITDHWPNAIIYPDNRKIRIYDRENFEVDHGNRLDYLYNTTEFKLTYDSTNLTNQVMCIGARYSVDTETETEHHSSSAGGGWGWPFPSVGKGTFMNTQLFGVHPGGGFRTNGFHDGLDFGSIDHPGSEVHAVHGGTVTNKAWASGGINYYVVTHSDDGYYCEYQEAFSNMGQIKVNIGDTVKTGDVIGYRDTDHLHLGITKSPLPGAFSKAFTNDGTWLDPIALIESGGDDEGETTTTTTSNSAEYFYFRPFLAVDEDSVKKYGPHPAEPIEDARFKYRDAMLQYALSKLQPEPALTVEVTTYTNFKPIPGDKVHILIRDAELSTNLAVVAYTWYPFSEDQYTSVTLNTNRQNILDYQGSQQHMLEQSVEQMAKNASQSYSDAGKGVWTQEEVNTFGANLKLH